MIKKVELEDLETVARLAVLMWNNATIQELPQEFSDIISQKDALFLLKYIQDEPVGFAQCQLRYDYVEGTQTSPVGYLEGVFVKKEYRNKGYAKELLLECEQWVRKMGCEEFASDCEIDNSNSFGFHTALGFREVNRIVCFTKKL